MGAIRLLGDQDEVSRQIVHHGCMDIDDVRRVWHDITRRRARRAYDSGNNPERTAMSALLDVETKLKAFGDRVTADLQDLITTAPPVIHDASESLERLTSSKIVVELEQLAEPIDPALETLIAAMIKSAGDAAAKVAELVAPADAQIQTGVAS